MATFTTVKPPSTGTAISRQSGRLVVPDNPIIPFIEGDGTGPDIWRASVRVLDAAVAKAYEGKRTLAWMEAITGQFYLAVLVGRLVGLRTAAETTDVPR